MVMPDAVFRPCAVVPVFDHAEAISAVVKGVTRVGLPCILVDDGSSSPCADVLDRLAATIAGVELYRRPKNGGKGAAVADGLRQAHLRGYTHALQIDADGQHDLADLNQFLAAAAASPVSMICGRPIFDVSIPKLRYYFRYLTQAFVRINTWSFDIQDAMCGFRVYPLSIAVALLNEERLGQRMDFDIEILVHLHWRGVPMRWIPTRVHYPVDGVSHFRVILDNVLITRVHTRLFFGMLIRLPNLLTRRWRTLMEPRDA
jgi:glycosyltransferase involved in cell wall biosynthesis